MRDVTDCLMTGAGYTRADATALADRHRERIEADLADGRRPRDIADAVDWADKPAKEKSEWIRSGQTVY